MCRSFTLSNRVNLGKVCWAMTFKTHIKRSLKLEAELAQARRALVKRAKTPLSTKYRPELDSSPELD